MITVHNVRPKSRVRNGIVYESTFDRDAEYHADIDPGRSIRIYGRYGNTFNGPVDFDKTFRVGDWAEYDSYNLKYNGRIIAIGPKTVTVKHYEHTATVSRMDLHSFCWRNWDFDLDKSRAHNADETHYI